MKAYYISIKDDEDQGGHLVWDTTVKNARKRVNESNLDYETWLDVQCYRQKSFDGMEELNEEELMLEKWKQGWWFDSGEPIFDDYKENTDEDFLTWYREGKN